MVPYGGVCVCRSKELDKCICIRSIELYYMHSDKECMGEGSRDYPELRGYVWHLKQKGQNMRKPDIWGQLWPSTPKVHNRVVTDLSYQLNQESTYSSIWTMVELAGVRFDEDVLATTRALRDLKNQIWP